MWDEGYTVLYTAVQGNCQPEKYISKFKNFVKIWYVMSKCVFVEFFSEILWVVGYTTNGYSEKQK